ncbi:MAG: hypothetical protein BWY83_01076 [bacterium ADurb.Bin478]|nr:MAG: hypothetical protein BWY83_01076 [bacterium ADurb.Bin478]
MGYVMDSMMGYATLTHPTTSTSVHAAPWALIIVQRISCRWWATLRFETTLQGSLFLDPRFRWDDILFLTG